MSSRIFPRSLGLLLLAISLISSAVGLADEHAGRMQDAPPTSGTFVRSDRGYMIPYDQVIPGTTVIIRMIPVPGGSINLQPPIAMEDGEDSVATEKAPRQKGEVTQVDVAPFWVSETEITMKQLMPYRQLYFRIKKKAPDKSIKPMEVGDVDGVTGPTDVYAPDVHFERATLPDAAAPSTTQYMARQYTKWLSLMSKHEYRLPMRSEWQHACRAISAAVAGSKGADRWRSSSDHQPPMT